MEEDRKKFDRTIDGICSVITRNLTKHERERLKVRADNDVQELSDMFNNVQRYAVAVNMDPKGKSPLYTARVTLKVMKQEFIGQGQGNYRTVAYDVAAERARMQALKLKDKYASKRYKMDKHPKYRTPGHESHEAEE